jgi:ribokinase
MSFDVITFGSAIVDIFLQSEEFKVIEDSSDKFICQPFGRKMEISNNIIASGGGGTNTAVSFSRQGLKTAAVCRFGDDAFGQLIEDELDKEGVAGDFLVRRNEQTDTSIILIGSGGSRTILVCRGQTRLETADIDWSKIEAKWVYLTSLEGNLDLVEQILKLAGERNIDVGWNPGKKELANKAKLINLARQVRVFNLNRKEMENLVDKKLEDDSFWQSVRDIGAELTVVTDGRQGAYLLYKQGLHFLPSPKTKPVDETGAGDAFGSGFVAGLIKGMEVKEAFQLAMNNGASVVQHIGAKQGLLSC